MKEVGRKGPDLPDRTSQSLIMHAWQKYKGKTLKSLKFRFFLKITLPSVWKLDLMGTIVRKVL